ncbi:MAG: hypothetical protein WCG87_06630 [Bacteroidota bacterium]
MARIHDDLMNDFKEQKKMIYEQIELLGPMANAMRKPAIQRLADTGAIIFFEIISYLLAVGSIAFAICLQLIYPLNIIPSLLQNPKYKTALGVENVLYLNIAVYGIIGIASLLFFIIARLLGKIRIKNNFLSIAGRDLKTIAGQHLKRKAAIDAIEQRHFTELPDLAPPMIVLHDNVNDVPNPAYENRQ